MTCTDKILRCDHDLLAPLATGFVAGGVCYDTGTDSLCVGDGAAWDCQVLGVTDTNTNASTICAGTTTYLDGEGNCDDISSVYAAASHAHTGADLSGIDISDDTNLAAGAGVALTGDTLSTASSEADFLANGALVCGASTQGKMQVHTTPLQ